LNHGCTCAACSIMGAELNSARWPRGAARAKVANEETLRAAVNQRQPWSAEDVQVVATRDDLGLVQLAYTLGRSREAVRSMRTKVRRAG
ncbi:MAG: hypothetical protein WAW17_05530, partial [Rhodococcus sp. (in: high G+C Gram-positive bacteria)]|uniref:hypothetical protein n=1 Tax=Rhodococcus sp. TaxID=1831 RepID=UPI003BB1E29A